MQYAKVEPSRLLTTNIFVQSFNFAYEHNNITQGGLADSVSHKTKFAM